jgi:transcriptional regulator with XRE-family HTH domain
VSCVIRAQLANACESKQDEGVAGISDKGWDLGGYLREQREHARLSVRQLANLAGVSNPYLSQVERGLRKPSAEVLQQIARGLRISAEALYVRAGILDSEGRPDVEAAVNADPDLNDRQRRVLLDIYASFRAENRRAAVGDDPQPARSTRRRSGARARSAVTSATAGTTAGTTPPTSGDLEQPAAPEPAAGVRRPRKRASTRTTSRVTARSTKAARTAAADGSDTAGPAPGEAAPDLQP